MNSKEITGMIAVFDNAALNARFVYTIDLTTNKVTYVIACFWKLPTPNNPNGVVGKCPFADYGEAAMFFDGLKPIAEAELRKRIAV